MEVIDLWTNLTANILTIFVSGIAIYVFIYNKDRITSAINLILNYSNQLTLTDIKFKIERLNDYNANDNLQKVEVINILHELQGQILGNKNLKEQLIDQLRKIESYTTTPRLFTEPRKRSLVSELKESIRTLDAANFNDIINSPKK